MITTNELQIEKDLTAKKISMVRHFKAPVEAVWNAWTQSEILDQWWAPKPFKAETKKMDFKEGGEWIYAMVGPDENKQYCKVEYKKIEPLKSFSGVDMFTDENGKRNPALPAMDWVCRFYPEASGTKVTIDVSFASVEDLNTVVEMGFEEGFAAALHNLDEVLA